MKIHYWGTAAAEGIPSVFCNCKVCQEARREGGRYIRFRSQVMLDDELLVDFGADTFHNSIRYGYDLSKLGDVLITHSHADHFYPQEFFNRIVSFAYDMKYETLTLHGSPGLVDEFYRYCSYTLIEQKRIALDPLEPYKKVKIGSFEVTPLPATHGTYKPYVFVIEKDGKTLLYHNDSGVLKDEVFEWLKTSGIKLDVASYDCTMGTMDTYHDWGENASHMGLCNVVTEREKMKAAGVYKDSTIDVVTHFSHNGPHVGYGEFKPLAEKEGFILAYDGFVLEI